MAKQESRNLSIPVPLHERLDEYCERKGRVKTATAAALVRWFLKQPGTVQQVVLGDVEPDAPIEAAHAFVLRQLADDLCPLTDPKCVYPPDHDGVRKHLAVKVVGQDDVRQVPRASGSARPRE